MSKKYTKWQDWEKQFVKENAKSMTDSDVAEHIGRTTSAVKGFRARNNILTGRTGYFEKGHKPFNKGKSQEEFMSKEALEKVKKTQFKEGHKPHNTKFDGCLSLRKESDTDITYIYYRESNANWKLYHRKIYRQFHGEIPEDKIIIFKDGNQFNLHPDNLKAITRAENARRNQNWEKAMQTMKENGNHPSHDMTDNWVAGRIAYDNDEMKEYILEERQDLIQIARANYKLKRQVNEHN